MSSVGPADQEAVEGHRKGAQVEAPKGTLGRRLLEERATEAVLDFLRDARVWCIVMIGGGRAGTTLGCIFVFFPALPPFPLSLPFCLFSFVSSLCLVLFFWAAREAGEEL